MIAFLNKKQRVTLTKLTNISKASSFSIDEILEVVESVLGMAISTHTRPKDVIRDIISDFKLRRDLRLENSALKRQIETIERLSAVLCEKVDLSDIMDKS